MTRHEMISKLSEGLGALVWYDLSGTRITPDRMRAILASEGDDPSVVPDIDPEAAVKRAIRSWTSSRGEFKAVIGSDTDDEIVVNILRKQRTGAKKVEMLLHDSATFSKASGSFAFVASKEAIDFVRFVEQMIETLDHSWLRPKLIHSRLAAMSAFVLRRQGGVYFVPSQFRDDLDKLARIVSQVGDSMLSIAHVEATDASQQNVSKHLGVLLEAGFVSRSREGNFVRYAIADEGVFELCELVCGGIRRQLGELDQILQGQGGPR